MKVDFLKKLVVCLTNVAFQLETSDESQVNSDFAVAMMEDIGASLQDLNDEEKLNFNASLQELAATETDVERKKFLKNFVDNFGLCTNN